MPAFFRSVKTRDPIQTWSNEPIQSVIFYRKGISWKPFSDSGMRIWVFPHETHLKSTFIRQRTNFRPPKKFDWTCRSHRNVQYFCSVHTEFRTTRRLETTKTQKCLTGWKCIRCHLTVITIQTILLQRLVLGTFLKDAFRAVNSTLSWSKG